MTGTLNARPLAEPIRRSTSPVAVLGVVLLVVVAAAACRPIPLGSAGATMGNQIEATDCPQSQPSSIAPCGPQPLFWAAIQGPYELFENGDHSKPAAELTGKIVAKAREKGLILLSCGTYYNVVRFLMPVTIPDAQLEKGLAIVAECFDELA